jgi:DNA invertase Pin-like site-specific DNA recombinase
VLSDRYDDGGYSGGTLERPALKRLLLDIENGRIDVIVVHKIDRLSRALMDFAKLVEVFERRSVTFVSVTQSFNTTTSMGRLTLNVLLSFAQFEREVTGERIRDKIAASKKKGIWMGGNPPLGYNVAHRKLVVNGAEAETVRLIFQRYLDLGCVRLLAVDLANRRIVSKLRVLANGKTKGGKSLLPSGLYVVLKNRVYVGETTHKGNSYRGEHKAIVPTTLFNDAQRRLVLNLPGKRLRRPTSQDAPYAGRLFDEAGAPMRATYSLKGNVRYRYYVSVPNLKGERSKATITRIPAPPLETLLANALVRLGLSRTESTRTILRVDVLASAMVIRFDRDVFLNLVREANPCARSENDALGRLRVALSANETLVAIEDRINLTLPIRAKFRGGDASLLSPLGRRSPSPNFPLIRAIARAYRWRELMVSGEAKTIDTIARKFCVDRSHVGVTLKLAFLSPKITHAILAGEQPPNLNLARLLATKIPLEWAAQDALLLAQSNATKG